jgi:hypothetical protein
MQIAGVIKREGVEERVRRERDGEFAGGEGPSG